MNMHVYFDSTGNIHAISPSKNDEFAKDNSCILLPLLEVEMFLTGKANLLDYTVLMSKFKGETKYKLIKKSYQINYVRNLDNYLTKIPSINEHNASVLIGNNLSSKIITLAISSEFKEMYQDGTDEQQATVSEFLTQGVTSVYITKRNDPYSLLFPISFLPSNLFNLETLNFRYKTLCANTSAYAKKIPGGYVYTERI